MTEKSPHTGYESRTPHQPKPLRGGKLPLLGSNQDSPDPESGDTPVMRAVAVAEQDREGTENTRSGGVVPPFVPPHPALDAILARLEGIAAGMEKLIGSGGPVQAVRACAEEVQIAWAGYWCGNRDLTPLPRRRRASSPRVGSRRALPLGVRFAVLTRDQHTCRYCGRKAPEVTLHVDHVVPVVRGGTDEPDNLVTACIECNIGKGSRPAHFHPDAAPEMGAEIPTPGRGEA